METETEKLLRDVSAFLDGLCIGHKIADAQAIELIKRIESARRKETDSPSKLGILRARWR